MFQDLVAPDPSPAQAMIMPRPRSQPPATNPKPDYGGIDLSLTDKLCIDMKASACEAITDMCTLMKPVAGDSGMCDGVQAFCEKQKEMGNHMHMDMDAKVCLTFEASARACEVVTAACKPGSKAAGSNFCMRAQSYCQKTPQGV